MDKSSGKKFTMWIIYAIGSSFFAGITAILAKCGIRKTDSDVATAIRTIVFHEKLNKRSAAGAVCITAGTILLAVI